MTTVMPTGKELHDLAATVIEANPNLTKADCFAKVEGETGYDGTQVSKAYYNYRHKPSIIKAQKIEQVEPLIIPTPISTAELKFCLEFIQKSGSSAGLEKYLIKGRIGPILSKLNHTGLIEKRQLLFAGFNNKPIEHQTWSTSSSFELMRELIK